MDLLDEIEFKEQQISGLITFLIDTGNKKFLKTIKRKIQKNQNNYPYLFVANIMDPVTIT